MKAIHNALGINTFNFLRGSITSQDMDWHFTKKTAVESGEELYSDFSFVNLVYDCEFHDSAPTSGLFIVCYNALLMSLDKLGVELDELYRIRIGLITNKGIDYTHQMHLDDASREKYNVGILYLTTNLNCPTIIEDGKLETKIEHVENTFAMFDGSLYHCSTSPTQEAVRININYNFLLK
jgi:hypothetical protein